MKLFSIDMKNETICNIIARIWAIVNMQATEYAGCRIDKVVVGTITYDRLWETMRRKGITQYRLIKDYQFSTGQLDRLRKNENLSTHTLDELCRILDCRLEEIAEYQKDE
jgi:DNA-binding Xre family transcriptional regulator